MTISTATAAALGQPQPVSAQLPATQQDWQQFASTLNQWLKFLSQTVSGTFLATMTGGTTSPSVTVIWWQNGNVVTALIPAVTVTSNSATCTLGAVPSNLAPAHAQTMACAVMNNSASSSDCGIQIDTAGVLSLFVGLSGAGFTSSGTKGLSSPVCVTWILS